MKKLSNKMRLHVFTQWLFQISLCTSSLVIPIYLGMPEGAIVGFCMLGICIPVMFWFLNPTFRYVPVVFSIPKPVLTDHGYYYVTLRKCVTSDDYALRIYSKFYMLGGICIYDTDLSDRNQYIETVADTIEEQVKKYIRAKEFKKEGLNKDFNDWDGVLTDKKEIVRDHRIDELL